MIIEVFYYNLSTHIIIVIIYSHSPSTAGWRPLRFIYFRFTLIHRTHFPNFIYPHSLGLSFHPFTISQPFTHLLCTTFVYYSSYVTNQLQFQSLHFLHHNHYHTSHTHISFPISSTRSILIWVYWTFGSILAFNVSAYLSQNCEWNKIKYFHKRRAATLRFRNR